MQICVYEYILMTMGVVSAMTCLVEPVATERLNEANGISDKLALPSLNLNHNLFAMPPFPATAPVWAPARAPARASASAVQNMWFWAGACVRTVLRAEAIPGRKIYASNQLELEHPFDAMSDAGFNAVRVETYWNTCATTTVSFDNAGDVLQRERNSLLDLGCIDVQVKTAQHAQRKHMKVAHTITLGANIPTQWQQYNYSQMLTAIDTEVRRQLTPFLEAGVQPDIILFENEDSLGLLYNVTLASGESYQRGTGNNLEVSDEQLAQELCGTLPTGHSNSYPQLAGYYKQEVLTCQNAIERAGFDPAFTRFGLHSQQQYIDWKQSLVYNTTNPDIELAVDINGTYCTFEDIIPSQILQLRASEMLDIMGFSSYPVPRVPDVVSSRDSMNETFTALRQTLFLMNKVASRYGKYLSGPFVGQYKKQGLAVEYASDFTYPAQIQDQLVHTKMYFDILQSYPWFLGALWWEPTWAYNHWVNGSAALYYSWISGNNTNEAPTATLKYWGSFAKSA